VFVDWPYGRKITFFIRFEATLCFAFSRNGTENLRGGKNNEIFHFIAAGFIDFIGTANDQSKTFFALLRQDKIRLSYDLRLVNFIRSEVGMFTKVEVIFP
jgi:hypothetical protein